MSQTNRAIFLTEADDAAYAQAMLSIVKPNAPIPDDGPIPYDPPDPTLVAELRKDIRAQVDARNDKDLGLSLDAEGGK